MLTNGENEMERDSKAAIIKRLRFAMAELEIVRTIALDAEQPALSEQVDVLRERVRACITVVEKDYPAMPRD